MTEHGKRKRRRGKNIVMRPVKEMHDTSPQVFENRKAGGAG